MTLRSWSTHGVPLSPLSCVLVLISCTVDDRILSTDRPPTNVPWLRDASIGDGQALDAQSDVDAEPPGSSMEAGVAGAPSRDAEPEPTDANDPNAALDECDRPAQQLQIANATFDSNEVDWDPDGNAIKDWSDEDANGSSNSGSLIVRNKDVESGTGLTSGGVSQCLEIPRHVGYQVCVDYLLGGSPSTSAGASVRVTLFDGEACSGSVSSSPSIPVQREQGGWETFKARIAAPPENSSFKSMLVKLASVKTKEDAPLEIQFDNVRIGTIAAP